MIRICFFGLLNALLVNHTTDCVDFLFDLPMVLHPNTLLCLGLFQQKLAKREVGTIDRSNDIIRLQEFYRLYRVKNNVDTLKEEEKQLRESGAFTDEYVALTAFSFVIRHFGLELITISHMSWLWLLKVKITQTS